MRISDWSSDVCSSDLHLTEAAHHRHHVRGSDAAVEVDLARLDLLGEVLGADHIGAGLGRLLRLRPLGEDRHTHRLAGAVRTRSEERRVGKGSVSTFRSRWSPYL